MRAHPLGFAVAIAAAGLACGGKKQAPGTEPGPAVPGPGADAGPAGAGAKVVPPALTANKLLPIVRELGVDGVAPTALVVELATPIVEPGRLGQRSRKTVLKITPDVAGTVTFTGVSTLTFQPDLAFAFATHYHAELKAVETDDGVIKPPAGVSWSRDFTTPSFAFLRWQPSDLDLAHHKVALDLVFSGPVLPSRARPFLEFAIAGQPTANLAFAPGAAPNVIRASLRDPRLAAGVGVRVAVKAGLPALVDGEAPAAKAEHRLPAEKAMMIKAAVLSEGSQGFYLEVVCNDQAAPSGSRYFYDRVSREDYYDLSSRCELPEEAAARVTFKPPVAHVYLSPGKAGFRIFGDFQRGTYSLSLAAGATTVDGGVLPARFQSAFSVPARKPQLAFAASGRYLPRSAWNNLGVKHLNVDSALLLVRHVPPEDLVFWLGDDNTEAAGERNSNLILHKHVALGGKPDTLTTTWLDVGSMLPSSTRGVLQVKLEAPGAQTTARLLLTNMSLVAKKSSPPGEPWNQRVHVWALDIDSNELIGGVDVSVVRKSGKVVGRCTTQGESGCSIATTAAANDPDRSDPFAIIARKGDDLTYIRYQDLKADVGESNTAGEPYELRAPYRATLWSDRGVYRPGDTAHVVALVRDGRDAAPAKPLPVNLKLVDARGHVTRKVVRKTNAAGMAAVDFPLAAFADTGHYRVELAVAGKTIARYGLQVEEIVPERMKVTVAPKKPDVLVTDRVAIDVGARYLFGGSAAGSEVELTCQLAPSQFKPTQNGDLTYGVAPGARAKTVTLGEENGTLDENGKATISCPSIERGAGFDRTATLTASVAVLEAGSGRSTVRTTTARVHPEKYYLGLKANTRRAETGKTFTVSGLVVDWNGAPLPSAVSEVSVQLMHLESEYDYSYDEDGESSYQRTTHEVPEGKTRAAVKDGRFRFDVTPGNVSSGYLVRVTAGGARSDLVLEGEYDYYDYYGEEGGGRWDVTPRPARPTQLALEVPDEIEVGAKVPVKVRAPYRGKMLFTVETDWLVAEEWKDVNAGDVSWSFKLAKFAPNVYVTAFLVKDPHAESKKAFLPDRAFGVRSARVKPTQLTQAVKITVPAAIRSSSTLTVKLDVADAAKDGPTFAAVAVVDEGLLSLTSFRTPDPLAALLGHRALGVETYETLGWTMLHPAAGPTSRTGGGEEEEEGGGGGRLGRIQPVKPVALFSGILPVDASGKLEIPFAVPAYRGELRVMVVTATPRRIGRAEASVTVKDPLIVQVTFPRFVIQDDEMQIPVFLTNLSGGPLDVSLALEGETLPVPGMKQTASAPAPLAFLGQKTGTAHLANGASETLVFQVKAAIPIGAARLKVTAQGKGPKGTFKSGDEVDVPFAPAGPKERIVQRLSIEQTSTDLTAILRGWVPTSERSTFWLTTNPYGETFDHLKYLVHYPYGCVEQTTSSTWPLLVVGNLVRELDPALSGARIEDMVLAGIDRLLSMQTASGGLGYWPGDTQAVDWGTAYATQFLLDARKASYPVPEDRLNAILSWMEDRVAIYARDGAAARRFYRYDQQAEPYLHYVLALAGRGQKARILRLIHQLPAAPKGAQAESKYMLEAALYLAGDRRYEKDLRSPDSSPISEARTNGWGFYSDRRARGFMLSTFYDLFGKDPAADALAQRVAESLGARPSYYYSTQELVWGVIGLGKWTEKGARDFGPAKLMAGDKAIAPQPAHSKGGDRTWALARASEVPALSLEVPHKGAGALYLIVSSEGVREKPEAQLGGNGLQLTRRYRSLSGDEVSLEDGSVKLGDTVFVEIEIANTSGQRIENIALVDRLPAGFEIQNQRLGRGTTPDWVDEDTQWTVDFLNLRDDRLEAFGSLAPKATKTVVYSVRAVTSGKFTLPPVEAEAMYDPTLWARAKGDTVIISGPWEGHLI